MCLSLEFVEFCVCPSFPFGIEGGMWDVIVLIPDHCFSIYLGQAFFSYLPRKCISNRLRN